MDMPAHGVVIVKSKTGDSDVKEPIKLVGDGEQHATNHKIGNN